MWIINDHLYAKKFQIKVVYISITYKNLNGRTYLSPPGVELGGSKDGHVQNIMMYGNGKMD